MGHEFVKNDTKKLESVLRNLLKNHSKHQEPFRFLDLLVRTSIEERPVKSPLKASRPTILGKALDPSKSLSFFAIVLLPS